MFFAGGLLSDNLKMAKCLILSKLESNRLKKNNLFVSVRNESIFYAYSIYDGCSFLCQHNKFNLNMVVRYVINVVKILPSRCGRWQKNNKSFYLSLVSNLEAVFLHREFVCFHQSTSIQ